MIDTVAAAVKSLQSCSTLWDPTDGSPPGSPGPWIFQARVLEWGAIAFSDDISRETIIRLLPIRQDMIVAKTRLR